MTLEQMHNLRGHGAGAASVRLAGEYTSQTGLLADGLQREATAAPTGIATGHRSTGREAEGHRPPFIDHEARISSMVRAGMAS